MSKDSYIANKQVSVAGGRQFSAGETITGDFDPDAPDNALLIEEGLISASTAADSGTTGDPAGSDAGDAEGGSGAQDASDGPATKSSAKGRKG